MLDTRALCKSCAAAAFFYIRQEKERTERKDYKDKNELELA